MLYSLDMFIFIELASTIIISGQVNKIADREKTSQRILTTEVLEESGVDNINPFEEVVRVQDRSKWLFLVSAYDCETQKQAFFYVYLYEITNKNSLKKTSFDIVTCPPKHRSLSPKFFCS